MRKIAAHRIVLPDGTVLHKEIVVLDDQNRVVDHYPLVREEANVEFYVGEYHLYNRNS